MQNDCSRRLCQTSQCAAITYGPSSPRKAVQDAFRDAERCAIALDRVFACTSPFDEAMSAYQRERDDHVPMYEFTRQLAGARTAAAQDVGTVRRHSWHQDAMHAFVRMNAGTLSAAEFIAPGNVGTIMAAAQVRA